MRLCVFVVGLVVREDLMDDRFAPSLLTLRPGWLLKFEIDDRERARRGQTVIANPSFQAFG